MPFKPTGRSRKPICKHPDHYPPEGFETEIEGFWICPECGHKTPIISKDGVYPIDNNHIDNNPIDNTDYDITTPWIQPPWVQKGPNPYKPYWSSLQIQ